MHRLLAGIVMGGSLLLSACGRWASATPAASAPPMFHSASELVVTRHLPAPDLSAAGLTEVADLVTPLEISATDNGRTLTLIGAYADPARTVLIFRESPDTGLPMVDVSDQQGAINAGSSTGPIRAPGLRGDYSVGLDGGPRAGPGGLAQLTISVRWLMIWSPRGGQVAGNWVFSTPLRVQPATRLAAPAEFRVGGWTVHVETLEVTPTVVHLQAVVSGAPPDAIVGPGVKASFLELLDPYGKSVEVVASGAGVTVPKQQLNASNYRNSRINYEWARPTAGTYRLRFQGGGGRYELTIAIGAAS